MVYWPVTAYYVQQNVAPPPPLVQVLSPSTTGMEYLWEVIGPRQLNGDIFFSALKSNFVSKIIPGLFLFGIVR